MTGKDTGLKALVKLTRAQYGSILHDPDTKYIVTDGETVREYLGDIPIGGTPILECTQAEYDAMQAHDSSTLYAIPEVV
jgi:hypothetical protein